MTDGDTARIDPVLVAPRSLDRLASVLGDDGATFVRESAARARDRLEGRIVWNVNTTAQGGGVAEMLHSLVAYARATGVDVQWVVFGAEADFYRVTKRLHNHLHGYQGDGGPLGEAERAIYAAASAEGGRDLARLVRPGDLVILHDPQTAGLAEPLVALGARVVWRSHIGADRPNDTVRGAWRFLLPYVTRTEAQVFSRAEYVWEGLDPARIQIIEPSIDPLTAKNHELTPNEVLEILRSAGIVEGDAPAAQFLRTDGTPGRIDHMATLTGTRLPVDAPAVTQVSRWDHLKDPLGIIDGFSRIAGRESATHLVLAGPDPTAVTDDPEGLGVFRECVARWHELAPGVRERTHLVLLPMVDPDENAIIVNALQRWSTVVVQKSVAEGFGLTVSEAMWKARPVVASRVGGIQDQIVDGVSGVLVDPHGLIAFGEAVLDLVEDPDRAGRIGAAAQERVRGHFLSAQHLVRYLDLFEGLVAESRSVPAPASPA